MKTNETKVKVVKIIVCIVGALMIAVGAWMCGQYNNYGEIIVKDNGTQQRNAIIGGVTGGVAGATLGALIGGVGIVACGTGVGVPVGAVCLGVAALFGGVGASTGYSTGTANTTAVIVHNDPVFAKWIWISLISIGGVLLLLIFINELRIRFRAKKEASKNNQ